MSSDFGKQSIKNRRERYAVRGNDRASPLGFRSSPSASPAENVSPYSGKAQPLRNYARRARGVPERGWAFPLGFSIVAIGVCKKKHQPTGWCFFLEAPPGFEPGVKDLQSHALPLGYGAKKWSGQRDSNSLPPPWQGGALPDELHPHSWCLRPESNQRHADFQSAALPTELQRHIQLKNWWEQQGSNL